MRNLLTSLSLLAFVSASYAVDTVAYGDWNSATTWKDGVIPSGEGVSGTLNGNNCNDSQFYYFDTDTSASQLNVGWSTGQYTIKSAGDNNPTFTLYGSNSANGVICLRGGSGGTAAQTQRLTIESGNYSIVAGTAAADNYARISLGSNSTSNPNIIKNLVFGSASNFTSSISVYFDNMLASWATNYSEDYTRRSSIDMNGKFSVDSAKSTNVRGVTLNVNGGSDVSIGQLNISNYAVVNVNTAMSVKPTGLAAYSNNLYVASTGVLNVNDVLTITSVGSTHHLTIAGTVNVNDGGSIAAAGGYGTIQIATGGVLRLASAENTVRADGVLRMGLGSRLILDSTNAYWGNFNPVRSKALWLSNGYGTTEQSTAFLDVNAYNQFSGFCFGTNRANEVAPILTVTIGLSEGVALDLSQLTCTLDAVNYGYLMGEAKLIFVNFRNNAVKVGKEHEAQTVDGITYADDFSLISAEGYEDFRLEKDVSGDFFWLTATAVPEPSCLTAMLGALALGFIVYRRRK